MPLPYVGLSPLTHFQEYPLALDFPSLQVTGSPTPFGLLVSNFSITFSYSYPLQKVRRVPAVSETLFSWQQADILQSWKPAFSEQSNLY